MGDLTFPIKAMARPDTVLGARTMQREVRRGGATVAYLRSAIFSTLSATASRQIQFSGGRLAAAWASLSAKNSSIIALTTLKLTSLKPFVWAFTATRMEGDGTSCRPLMKLSDLVYSVSASMAALRFFQSDATCTGEAGRRGGRCDMRQKGHEINLIKKK